MFNRITPVPAAGTSSTLPTTSRRAFGRRLGLSAAGLTLAGCSAPESSADSAPAEAVDDQPFLPAQDAASQAAITTDAALTLLTDGNARFVAGTPARRDYSDQIRATAGGQYPFAVVLGCIDSRVPIETIFDQGIGDIFAARIAGNIVNTEILGSHGIPLSAYGNGLGTLCAGMIGIVEKTNQTQEKPSPWLTIIQYSRRCSSWCRDMSSRAWHASTSRDGWPVA